MSVTLKDVGSGFKRTAINENFTTIETELNDNVLRRDSVTGANQMEVNLDLNSNRILNLPDAIDLNEAVNYGQMMSTVPFAALTGETKQYPALSFAIADTTLEVGETFETLGYLASGDGGGNKYTVVPAGTGVADGGSYIDLAAHQAKGDFGDKVVNVRKFGMVHDDGTVQDIQYLAAGAYAYSIGGHKYLPKGWYKYTTEDNTNVSVIGDPGSLLEFDYIPNTGYGDKAIRPRGYMDTAKTASRSDGLGTTLVSTAAAIDDQPAGQNYVTCSTAGDATNFTRNDVVMIQGGKDPWDANQYGVWRYKKVMKVKHVDATTGKVELSRIINVPLSSDGFEPTGPYYDPADYATTTAYTTGDTVIGSSSLAADGIGVFKALKSFTSSTSIDADLVADPDAWGFICENLGGGETVSDPQFPDDTLAGTFGNDRRPLIQKMELPLVDLRHEGFTLRLTEGKNSIAAVYTNATYNHYCNFEVEGDFMTAFLIAGGCSLTHIHKSNHSGANRQASDRYRYINQFNSDVTVSYSEGVSGCPFTSLSSQPNILLEAFSELRLDNCQLSRTFYNGNASNVSVTHGSTLHLHNTTLTGAGVPVGTSGYDFAPHISGTYDPRHWRAKCYSTGGNWLESTVGNRILLTQGLGPYLNSTIDFKGLNAAQQSALGGATNYVFHCEDTEIVEQRVTVAASQSGTNVIGADDICQAFQEKGNYYVVSAEAYWEGNTLATGKTITGVTATNPAVITATGHSYVDGDRVFIQATGVAALDNNYFTVANTTPNTFEVAADGTGYSSGGTSKRVGIINVSPFHAYNNSNYSGLFNSSVVADGNTMDLSRETPYGRLQNGSVTGNRLLLGARASQFGLRYSSNADVTAGTLILKFYCVRGNTGDID